MDLKEAQLIDRAIGLLVGSTGKSVRRLANESGISVRRATYFFMCLEKAGMVRIDHKGTVSLSPRLPEIVWHHVSMLQKEDFKKEEDNNWAVLHQARSLHAKAASNFQKKELEESFDFIFKGLFGGAK